MVLHKTLYRLNFLVHRQSRFTIAEDFDYILCNMTERRADYKLQKEFYSEK